MIGYCDGAASKNGSKDCIAGWAYVLLDNNEEILNENSGQIKEGTNNIGEMQAIINLIKYFNSLENKEPLTIYTDSSYCYNGITNWRHNWKKNGWYRDAAKKQVLKNREMWIELDSLISPLISFEWVKGHAESKWNNYVDKKAVKETHV